jgi:hypothetical protein
MKHRLDFLLYVIILGIILNIIANVIWKYIPTGNYHLDIVISCGLLFTCIGLSVFKKTDTQNQFSNELKTISLESFTINTKRCKYIEHQFDPHKPNWIKEDNGSVIYSGGTVTVYGKTFPSWQDAEKYRDKLRLTRNHISFNEHSPHKIYFERQEVKGPNYPVFYFAIRNNKDKQVIIKSIRVIVHNVQPLSSIGESQVLEPIQEFEIKIEPSPGITELSLFPVIKVAGNDSTSFGLKIIPLIKRLGGYSWLMNFQLILSDDIVLNSDNFIIII